MGTNMAAVTSRENSICNMKHMYYLWSATIALAFLVHVLEAAKEIRNAQLFHSQGVPH